MSAKDIQRIPERVKLSQSVYAKILNVSSSSVRQWEQGKRTPTGSTKVLLELLKKNPGILNYRKDHPHRDSLIFFPWQLALQIHFLF